MIHSDTQRDKGHDALALAETTAAAREKASDRSNGLERNSDSVSGKSNGNVKAAAKGVVDEEDDAEVLACSVSY